MVNFTCKCGVTVQLKALPVRRGPSPFQDAWVCNACADAICVNCYAGHTQKKHPNLGVKK